MLNGIHNVDCLEGIKKIPSKTVKLVIADAPFAQGMASNGKRVRPDDMNMLRPFYTELFSEVKRVLVDNGEIFFKCCHRSYGFYFPIFDDVLGVRNLIIWDKVNAQGAFYSYGIELIIYGNLSSKNFRGGHNVWKFPTFNNLKVKNLEGAKVHNCQTPKDLVRKMIGDTTEPGDLVLDLFSGSGTVAIVAEEMERNFIAFEHNQLTFLDSLERCQREVPKSFFIAA